MVLSCQLGLNYDRPLLVRWIPSLLKRLIIKQGPLVIETKTLLLTPALQPIVDMQYQLRPPHTLSPHQQD